jgi:hypothetical protein
MNSSVSGKDFRCRMIGAYPTLICDELDGYPLIQCGGLLEEKPAAAPAAGQAGRVQAHSPMASPTRKRLRCAQALYALVALPLLAPAGTRHSPVPPALNTNADAVDDAHAATMHARSAHRISVRPRAIEPGACCAKTKQKKNCAKRGNERGWLDGWIDRSGWLGVGAVLNASKADARGTVLFVKARERERCEEAYLPALLCFVILRAILHGAVLGSVLLYSCLREGFAKLCFAFAQ